MSDFVTADERRERRSAIWLPGYHIANLHEFTHSFDRSFTGAWKGVFSLDGTDPVK
jgi:hypothetical protein